MRVHLESPQVAGEKCAVTDGALLSTPDIVRAIAQALGRPVYLAGFPPSSLRCMPALRRLTDSLEVDDSAIRSELGWRPPCTFAQGLRATAEWYLAQGR